MNKRIEKIQIYLMPALGIKKYNGSQNTRAKKADKIIIPRLKRSTLNSKSGLERTALFIFLALGKTIKTILLILFKD